MIGSGAATAGAGGRLRLTVVSAESAVGGALTAVAVLQQATESLSLSRTRMHEWLKFSSLQTVGIDAHMRT